MRTSRLYETFRPRTLKAILCNLRDYLIVASYVCYYLLVFPFIWPFKALHNAAHDRTRFTSHRLGLSHLLRKIRSATWRNRHPVPPPPILPTYVKKRHTLSVIDLSASPPTQPPTTKTKTKTKATTATATTTTTFPSRLLSLPPELRNQIWTHVLGARTLHITRRCSKNTGHETLHHLSCTLDSCNAKTPRIPCTPSSSCPRLDTSRLCNCLRTPPYRWRNKPPGPVPRPSTVHEIIPLLQTSRQVYLEASHVLYSRNTFDFANPDDFADFMHALLPSRRREIRSVKIKWPAARRLYDLAKWRLVSGSVRRVCAVAVGKRAARGGWSSPWECIRIFGEEMDKPRLQVVFYVCLDEQLGAGGVYRQAVGREYWLRPLASVNGGLAGVHVRVWTDVRGLGPVRIRGGKPPAEVVRRWGEVCEGMDRAVEELVRRGEGIVGGDWVDVGGKVGGRKGEGAVWAVPGVFGQS